MNFLALNDDVKLIITKHLQSDCRINEIFMTEPDDNLQKIIFGEVKEMTIDIDNICIDLVNNNKKIEFFFWKTIIIKFIWVNILMNHMKNQK